MAMASVSAEINVGITAAGSSDSGMGSAKDTISKAGLGLSKTGGLFYTDDAAIANPQTWTLGSGSTCKDAFGADQAFVTLFGLYIKNNTGGTLQIGAGANPLDIFGIPVGDTFELVTGATFLYLNPTGLTLTGGVDDDLKIAGAAGAIDLMIIGA